MAEEKKKRRWLRVILSLPLVFVLFMLLMYFIKPAFITDFLHIGIDRDAIKLREEKLTPREKVMNKWHELEQERNKTGYYPAFTFDSQELQIFVQERYKHALTEEIRGVETSLSGDKIILRLKLNLSKYESEIRESSTPELAKMLKEDIVLSAKGSVNAIKQGKVYVSIDSVHFGFIPVPVSLIEKIVNADKNVKKYGRKFDYTAYPLPKGIRSLVIKDSILYVNQSINR
ncbi:MAG: hypothetical protein JW737_07005 [Acidobacteria bacterium]|nr:hypothetical protein [Acidobacteriota bacterium]